MKYLRLLIACLLAVSLPILAEDHRPVAAKKSRPALGASAAFAADGTLFAVGVQGERLVLFRSADLGKTWDAPVPVTEGAESVMAGGDARPKLVVADGVLHVAWTRPLTRPYTGEVRYARSSDGKNFSAPITVHQDRSEITHAFESMLVTPDGRVVIAWIDKRGMEAAKSAKVPYRGAGVYVAVSNDAGRSFMPERKLADHACECCRIAGAIDTAGNPVFMWRHVFEPNERDHAAAVIGADGSAQDVQRVTFDRWKIDGCPHHGPALAMDGAGTRHAVWFNQKDGEGHAYYGRLSGGRVDGQRTVGGVTAQHADLVVTGRRVVIAWKEFDGVRARLRAEISDDAGASVHSWELASTDGSSDQPRVLTRGNDVFVFWRTEREGLQVKQLNP